MKHFIGSLVLILALVSCSSNESKKTEVPENLGNTHKVIVLDVLQTPVYTYLYVKENEKDLWLAVPRTEAKKNDILYYDGGMLMTNFHSKELNRNFDEVLFLEGVRKTLKAKTVSSENSATMTMPHNGSPKINKEDIKVIHTPESITIAELYKNKNKYSGKTITVIGKVVKFNEAIMNKNWVHIQDGTEFENNFDLTITTQAVVKKGENVVFEGKVTLDKDFGYGYSYKVLLENAVLKKK